MQECWTRVYPNNTRDSYLGVKAAAHVFMSTFSFCSASAAAHPGSMVWIQLIETQTELFEDEEDEDQLAGPQGRRVQIDPGPLLLQHICHAERCATGVGGRSSFFFFLFSW